MTKISPNTTPSESASILRPLNKDKLLQQLRQAPDDKLGEAAARIESERGGLIEPVYGKRQMRCYSVTESELKQIVLANLGITVTASLGSFFLALALDVYKDTLLAESVLDLAQVVVSYVQPISLVVGLSLWAFSGLLMWWRHSMVDLIKKESVQP